MTATGQVPGSIKTGYLFSDAVTGLRCTRRDDGLRPAGSSTDFCRTGQQRPAPLKSASACRNAHGLSYGKPVLGARVRYGRVPYRGRLMGDGCDPHPGSTLGPGAAASGPEPVAATSIRLPGTPIHGRNAGRMPCATASGGAALPTVKTTCTLTGKGSILGRAQHLSCGV